MHFDCDDVATTLKYFSQQQQKTPSAANDQTPLQ